jgi:hypothetical protein
MNSEKAVAWLGLIVAVFAVGIGVYDSHKNRLHNRLTVQPLLGFVIEDQPNQLELYFINQDVGQALLHWTRIYYDGDLQETWTELLQKVPRLDSATMPIVRTMKGIWTIPPNDKLLMMKVPDFDIKRLNEFTRRIRVETCYCSIYNECYLYELSKAPDGVLLVVNDKSCSVGVPRPANRTQ